uniref:BED-type domain-containing protein n=1 Tax=Tanacetum cinerariifolium TaxID=118510 RepID=A0A6L2LQR8_TANCI|nr:hypothetical protein [Tanacetum cinerariifolium]
MSGSSQEQNTSEANEEGASSSTMGKTRSSVWIYFTRIPIGPNGVARASCNSCGAKYTTRSGTTNMIRHISKCFDLSDVSGPSQKRVSLDQKWEVSDRSPTLLMMAAYTKNLDTTDFCNKIWISYVVKQAKVLMCFVYGRHEKAFFTGLKKFIEHCKALVNSSRNVKCPSKSFRNVSLVSIPDLPRHITNNRWDPRYKTWTNHEESNVFPPVIHTTTQPQMMSDMTTCLNDLNYIPSNNEQNKPTQRDIGQISNELTQAMRNDFKELYASANEELYPGCDYVTRLDFMLKFTYFKVKGKLTYSIFNEMLEFFQNVFPTTKGYKLPPSYYAIKKTFKMIGLGYESIQACINECFLFWGEDHKDKLQCLYKSSHTAKDMTWHATRKYTPPGLAANGFNPFNNISQSYNMWLTINEFPSRSSLSGWRGKGYKACPIGNEDTLATRALGKTTYVGHRRFLKKSYKWRMSLDFNGEIKDEDPPRKFNRDDIMAQLARLPTPVKVKHPIHHQGKTRLEKAGHSKWLIARPKQKQEVHEALGCVFFHTRDINFFCQFMKRVKLPDVSGSNFKHKVIDNDTNIIGPKSHDCHIMMQHLLSYGLQQYLPTDVAKPIIKLCLFFKQICSQISMVDDMVKAQRKVVDILCNLELIYLPGFFDIMIYLVIHLPLEALEGGPIHPQWINVDCPPPRCQFQVFRSVCKSIGLWLVICIDQQELKKVIRTVLFRVKWFDTSNEGRVKHLFIRNNITQILENYGQSIDVDAPPDIINVNENDDIIDDEDVLHHDLADYDDEDLIIVYDDDANVTRGKGSDGGGDGRPLPHQLAGGHSKTQFERQECQQDAYLQGNREPQADHEGGPDALLFLAHHPVRVEGGVLEKIETQFELKPHMQSKLWPKIKKGIDQHLGKIYTNNKSSLKRDYWVKNPENETYNMEVVRS